MMPIQFHTSLFILILICLLVLAGVLMMWKEWKNKEGKWLKLRLTSVVIAILSLMVILLRPSFERVAHSENVLLLTPFADSLAVKDWVSQHPTSTIIDLSDSKSYLSEQALSHLNIDTILWAGVGPKENERAFLKKYTLRYLNNSIRFPLNYFDSIRIKDEISLSEVFEVGAVFVSDDDSQTLIYEGFTGIKDSVLLLRGSNKISFKEQAKTVGNFTSKLVLKKSNQQKEDYLELPVKVKSPKSYSVLMMSSYPQFENRYLKEWLANQGFELVVRTAISKEKFRDEFFNTTLRSVSLEKPEFYNRFDFVLADAIWLNELSALELNSIKRALQDSSKALIVFPDSRINQLKSISSSLVFVKSSSEKPFYHHDKSGIMIELSPSNNQLKVGQSILPNQEGLGKWIRFGKSKIGVVQFSNAYQWVLQGHQSSYSELWSTILGALGKQTENIEWTLKTAWPIIDESVSIDLITKDNVEEIAVSGPNNALPEVIQDLYLPELFHIKIRPETRGWFSLKINNASINQFQFYVSEFSSSSKFLLMDKLKSNLHFFNKENSSEGQVQKKVVYENVILWPFFTFFLLAMAFLWLEPRI